MSNKKTSQLTTAGALDGTELVPIVQGGVTVKTTISALVASSGTITTERFEVTGTAITLANIPVSAPIVFKNGQLLNGITVGSYVADYSYSGVNITLTEAAAGDLFLIINTHL